MKSPGANRGPFDYGLDTPILSPLRSRRKRAMNLPQDFPSHLKAPVDTAIAVAEIEFAKAHKKDPAREDTIRQMKRYVRRVFFAFAHAAVKAVGEGACMPERCRDWIKTYRHDLMRDVYYDKIFWQALEEERHQMSRSVQREIESMEEWTQVQEELKAAIEIRENARSIKTRANNRKGYRAEIQQWIRDQGLPNQQTAARKLGVSLDVLKSIMSDRGRQRYSEETLKTVLQKIGLGDPK